MSIACGPDPQSGGAIACARAVQLCIQANPGVGYRTYSRNDISRERAGDWRVELRSANGTVLHEERFTVR